MRCRLAIIGLVALAPLTASIGWWRVPETRVNADSYERIRKDMTLKQVEEILGERGTAISLWDQTGDSEVPGYSGVRMWNAGACTILVVIEGDRVVDMALDDPTMWQRIDDWCHRRERIPGVKILRYDR